MEAAVVKQMRTSESVPITNQSLLQAPSRFEPNGEDDDLENAESARLPSMRIELEQVSMDLSRDFDEMGGCFDAMRPDESSEDASNSEPAASQLVNPQAQDQIERNAHSYAPSKKAILPDGGPLGGPLPHEARDSGLFSQRQVSPDSGLGEKGCDTLADSRSNDHSADLDKKKGTIARKDSLTFAINGRSSSFSVVNLSDIVPVTELNSTPSHWTTGSPTSSCGTGTASSFHSWLQGDVNIVMSMRLVRLQLATLFLAPVFIFFPWLLAAHAKVYCNGQNFWLFMGGHSFPWFLISLGSMACMFHHLMMASQDGPRKSIEGVDAYDVIGSASSVRVPLILTLAGTLTAMAVCTYSLYVWHVRGNRMDGFQTVGPWGGMWNILISKAMVMMCVGICGMCLFAGYYFFAAGRNLRALKQVMVPVALAVMWCCVWMLGEAVLQTFDSFVGLGEGYPQIVKIVMEMVYVLLWTRATLPLCRKVIGYLEGYFMPKFHFKMARLVQLWIDCLFVTFKWAYNRFIFLKMSFMSLIFLTVFGFSCHFVTYVLQYDPIFMMAMSRAENKAQ